MCADLQPQNNLNLQFHRRRNQCELDGYLKVRKDPRFHLVLQTLRDVRLNRFANKQVKISGELKDLVIVLYQFLTSLME